MIRGVLFDMDGVLFDTETLGMELMPKAARAYGKEMDHALYHRLLGVNEHLGRQILLEAYGEDIVILAVDPFYSAQDIRVLRDELDISFPLLQDPLGLSGGFRVESYPTTVFIDSTGTIRKIHRTAFTDEAAFLRAVAAYL